MKKRQQRGFTLYELLITFLVVGVILALGVPNMAEFTQNSRMTSTANDLHAAFQLARSEAARAKGIITVCASADPFGAADCDGSWDQGYVVFVDDDLDGDTLDDDGNISVDPGESILRRNGPAATGISLAVANDASYFSFAGTGLGRGNVDGNPALSQVVMCDERGNITAAGGNSAARLFVATPLGRATVLRDQAMIANALGDMGKPCP